MNSTSATVSVEASALLVFVGKRPAREHGVTNHDRRKELPLLLRVQVAVHVGHPPGRDLDTVVRGEQTSGSDRGAVGIVSRRVPLVPVVCSVNVLGDASLVKWDERRAEEVAHLDREPFVIRRIAPRFQLRTWRPTVEVLRVGCHRRRGVDVRHREGAVPRHLNYGANYGAVGWCAAPITSVFD